MRPVKLILLSASLLVHACSGSSSDPESLDENPISRIVAPPALAPVAPAADDDASDTNTDGAPAAAVGGAKAYHNPFEGNIDGITLTPTYSFFLQGVMRVGDVQPTLLFVQTDTPNLCQHLAAGTMPKNATILGSALMQADGQPVQAGRAFSAPGHHGMDKDPIAMTFFRKLSNTCEVSPGEDGGGVQAMYGEAIIRKLVDNTHAVIDYAFSFEEAGTVTGHVEAPYCDAPNFFANPEQFAMPVEPQNCLDH